MSDGSKLKRIVDGCGLIARGDRILVAVSGGPDSMALLHVLDELRADSALHLEVAHLQHGLRGDEAKTDARFVSELAKKLGCVFHLREIDLPRMKLDRGNGNLEALARSERYQFFAELARERKLDKVATGHTLDDQAETALMWFLRGTGLKGLGGMAPVTRLAAPEVVVIRPFLEISKAEILDYLKNRSIGFCVDRTNRDPSLLRNWLRLELVPKLQNRVDDRLSTRLVQQAEIFRDEDALLDRMAANCLAAIATNGSIERGALLDQPKALQRRILRVWIGQIRGHLRGLDYVHIEDGLRLISGKAPQGRVAVPGGWELVREYDRLKIAKQFRGRRQLCYNYSLHIGAILVIQEAGLEFHSERRAAPETIPDDLMKAVFDIACLAGPLSVRNFRRGDRFQPLGMKGHKKIKELFIEKRVPLSLRACWPLLLVGDEILWIPGYGRSSVGSVSDSTTAVLSISATSKLG